jgi:hypothetical protein
MNRYFNYFLSCSKIHGFSKKAVAQNLYEAKALLIMLFVLQNRTNLNLCSLLFVVAI